MSEYTVVLDRRSRCCLNFVHTAQYFHIYFALIKPTLIILSKLFYSLTDAQGNCLKNNFKMCIKIYIKTAPSCFGVVTPSSGGALLVLAKVTVFFSLALRPNAGHGLFILDVSRSHTTTHHSR